MASLFSHEVPWHIHFSEYLSSKSFSTSWNCWNFSSVKGFCIKWSKRGSEDDRFGEYVLYRRTSHPDSIIICCITLATHWRDITAKPSVNFLAQEKIIFSVTIRHWRESTAKLESCSVSETHSKQLSLNTKIFSGRFRSGWYTERRINSC